MKFINAKNIRWLALKASEKRCDGWFTCVKGSFLSDVEEHLKKYVVDSVISHSRKGKTLKETSKDQFDGRWEVELNETETDHRH